MSKPKFTPGPWTATHVDTLKFTHVSAGDFVNDGEGIICGLRDSDNGIANARLIAAAPALVLHLESLLTILNAEYVREHLIQLDHDYIAIAKADLRKATGGGK